MLQNVSARMIRAVQESHTATARIDIVRGAAITSFKAIDGVVTFDFDDTTRRSLDITFIDESGRTFIDMERLTDPFTCSLKPYRGIDFSNNGSDVEWMGLGEYFTDRLEILETSEGVVQWRISALDASSMCRTPLQFPVFIPGGVPGGEAIPQILRQVWPRMNFQIREGSWTMPPTLIDEDKVPWDEAVRLAQASGQDLFITRDGLCVMGSRPSNVSPRSNWDFVEGQNATFWEPKRNKSSRLPNVVVVIGTNTLAPGVRGEAYDTDPYSPTYVNGPYGRIVETYKSELVVVTEQAEAMARNILNRRLGPADEVEFYTTPIPFLDEADTISVTRDRMGMNQRQLLISHLEVPLLADDGMRVVGRRTVTSEGRAA